MLALALALLSTPAHSPASTPLDVSSGAALVKGCDAELRLMQPGALASADSGDLAAGSYCVGYVNGFLANSNTTASPICTGQQTMADLLRNYLDFMGANPSLLGKDKRLGLRLSLQQAFPCPVPGSAVVRHPDSKRDSL